MMESEPESPENGTLSEEIASLPQSYAFTVHFDNSKPGGETTNKFARRHIRNLSLPISKVYENKASNESVLNGRCGRKAGNHSEGYFSSDPDDDSKPKLFEMKVKHTDNKGVNRNAVQERRGEMVGGEAEEKEKDEDTSSDVASETGTYTIDKDSPEVDTARKNIDTVFGVTRQTIETKKNQVNSTHTNCSWVSEWVEHSTSTTSTKADVAITKIPSPVNLRSRLTPSTMPMRCEHTEPVNKPSLNRKSYPVTAQEVSTPEPERDKWVKETERSISVLQARVTSASLDSGGESDAENSLGPIGSTGSTGLLRYNRTASLRRDRLPEPKKSSTSLLATSKTKEAPIKSIPLRVMKRMSDPPPASAAFSRTDCGRFSMRSPRPPHQSTVMTMVKKEPVKKSMSIIGSGRSNSTLSSKEKEYQNWKKRKSYDPMKAAAEGKKKDAAKKQPTSTMTQSTNSTITTPKSPVNPVLRSASFHGTRQLTASSSEEEEEEEITLSAEDEDWPILQVPRSSLENTPQGSRVSLYSNTSNSPTPPLRNRPKLEGVDTLVISALAGLSSKLKGSSCSLLNKLRFLYDEDNPKSQQLSTMIDQLEASEPGSPQVKSPSRELATTLRNLKRLESMLKVLDNVLFDEEEFQ